MESERERLTFVRCSEFVTKHGIYNRLNVFGLWTPGTVVNFRFSNDVVRRMTSLQYVQSSSHIPFGKLQQRFFPVRSQIYTGKTPKMSDDP